ncbi:MAG: peptide ABC transporter substrate-binding protein [Rhabdochlamydiaceae bacterium]|nr:peptide ABC transporter substrate-binding protein [Rhabdochlamydiaceae bacterium]
MVVHIDDIEINQKFLIDNLQHAFHPSFDSVYEKLQKWETRFPLAADKTIFKDFFLINLLTSKTFFDHRSADQIFRLSLSLHLTKKALLHSATFSSHERHLEIRWIPANLIFPFCTKPVLGCLIGFNLMDRYEVFDEENIVLALQKYLPGVKLVKDSVYHHSSPHRNLKIFYFEIEKDDHTPFSPSDRALLNKNLNEKIKNSIQTLAPTIFMKLNEEEIYKNILVLGQEIQKISDLPQSYITLDQQNGKEISFRVTLVYVSPFHRFSMKERFFDCLFTSERLFTIRHLEEHPVKAHIFRLSLPRLPEFLRSDGSLDFYSARQKVVAMMTSAIGEFRDYNGGIIIKQQEQLQSLKEAFPEEARNDAELIETFFYALSPLEKQIILQPKVLAVLFGHFLENRNKKLPKDSTYSINIEQEGDKVFVVIHTIHSSFPEIISSALQEFSLQMDTLTYNVIHTLEGTFFNAVLLQTDIQDPEPLIQALRKMLDQLHQKMNDQQVLRIGCEFAPVSLDPRIGGEDVSSEVLKLLFEGLTRFNKEGNLENGIAEWIKVSPDLKEYIFKLRSSFWNDETQVSAYDFEYAWKKILSPDFKTSFAHFFYPIKNAKEAKEGFVSPDQIGIHVLDDRTLKVELAYPAPYFLQLVAHTLYSPVHRITDQKRPQWPHQVEKNYPCNGPFQLKINQPGQGYQFVKNPLYWNAQNIKLDQVIINLMSPSHAIRAFQKKEVDWIGAPFGGWHAFYAAGEDDKIIACEDRWLSWCAFNTQLTPFNHPKMRQAFAFAIDRQPIVTSSVFSLKPAHSPLPRHLCENNAHMFPGHNPEKARQLFQETLDELGLTKEEMPPITLTFLEKGIRQHIASSLKKQIEECFGIQCQLEPLLWNAFFDKMTKGDSQLALVQWVSKIDDPIYVLNGFKTADLEINFSKWENVEFRCLLDECEMEVNPFQRSALLSKAEKILCREMPMIPLCYQSAQALVRKNLQVSYQTLCDPFKIAQSFYEKEV